MDTDQLRRCLSSHRIRDERTPITALRHESAVTEALHQPNHARAMFSPMTSFTL